MSEKEKTIENAKKADENVGKSIGRTSIVGRSADDENDYHDNGDGHLTTKLLSANGAQHA